MEYETIQLTRKDSGSFSPIHVICVNTDKASTTLVISGAAAEHETHIAWAHY